jgi:hypothetical protein
MRISWSIWRKALAGACLAMVLGAACQRRAPGEMAEQIRAQRAGATESYPWTPPHRQQQAATDPAEGSGEPGLEAGAVELPDDLGRHPALGSQDTLDVAQLPGDWLLVCNVDQEALRLREPNNFYLFKFAAGGTLSLLPVIDGQVSRAVPGTWEKTGPGKLLMSINNGAPLTYYCEMLGTDFFYLWTFDSKNGLWLARRPAESTPVIEGNEFAFTSGERLHLTGTKGIAYDGYIEGPTRLEVSGGYSQGVLSMHWIDRQSNSDGYAMFIVSPDWKSLHGTWWLNDYTAVPFGGTWDTAQAVAGDAASAAPAGAAAQAGSPAP